jgi:hypothetical protein
MATVLGAGPRVRNPAADYFGKRLNSVRNSTFARSSTRRRSAVRPPPLRLIWKLSMDIAEWNGALLRRLRASAERLSEAAIARGEFFLKTRSSRSSALLVRLTSADQRALRALPRACVSVNDRRA